MDESLLNKLGVKGTNDKISLTTMEQNKSRVHTKVVNNLELYDMHGNLHDRFKINIEKCQ